MDMYHALLLVQLAVVAFCVLFIAVVLPQKASETSKMLLVCAVLAFVQNTGYFIELSAGLSSNALSGALAGAKVKYLGCAFIMTIFLMFVISYCRAAFPKQLLSLYFAIDLCVMLGMFMFPYSTIYYKSVAFTDGIIPHMKITRGALYYVYVASEAFQVLCCLIIPIHKAKREVETTRKKGYYIIALGALVAAMPYILQVVSFIQAVDIVPMCTALSAMVFVAGILHYHLFDLAESAQSAILKGLSEGVIVLDACTRFVYANDAARRIFPSLADYWEGRSMEDFELSPYFIDVGDCAVTQEYEKGSSSYYVTYSRIMEDGFHVGYRVLLADVSNERAKGIRERAREMRGLSRKVLETLAEAIDAKDKYTRGHSLRVSLYAAELAKAAGEGSEIVERIRYAGLLHDIGKIGVSDNVLCKAGKLNNDEFDQIKEHTTKGGAILSNLEGMADVCDVALHHHEKYDGSGYPDHLKRGDIPYGARIVGIADSYDAMRSSRVYRDGLPKDVILDELSAGRGKQFDPALDDKFIGLVKSDVLDKIASLETVAPSAVIS